MKARRSLLSLTLALLLCVSLFPTALAEEQGTIAPVEEIAPTGEENPPPTGDGAQSIIASGDCGDFGMRWALDDQGTMTISGVREMRDYYSHAAPWNDYKEQIVSLVILSGPTSIGWSAFESCTNLRSVTLPGTLQRIGQQAFSGCTSLTQITIPEGVTTLDMSCFAGCTALCSVSLPQTALSYGKHVFAKCSSLDHLELPANLTRIPDGILKETPIRSITIPEGVTQIGSDAFRDCTELTSICFPEGLERICSYAFENCKALKEIEFTGDPAFYEAGCFNGVTATAYYPAWNTNWLSMANSTGSIKYVPKYNVDPDALIASGTFGENLSWTVIGSGKLTISGTGEMPDVSSSTVPWRVYREALTSVVIEPGVTGICASAFRSCVRVESISIPDSVARIGKNAFSSCRALKEIRIPDGVTELTDYVFSSCSSLRRIELPEGITSIGMEAFYFCIALTDITLPEALESIGYMAFSYCGVEELTFPASFSTLDGFCFSSCENLSRIRFLGPAPSGGTGCFDDVIAKAYYPAGDESWTEQVRLTLTSSGSITWLPWPLPGDANGDGEADVLDLVRLLKALSGAQAELNSAAIDLNGDASVNSQDLILLRKLLVGSL